MATSFPWDKLKAETLRSICGDLGLPKSQKDEMVTALRSATVQSNASDCEYQLVQIALNSALTVRLASLPIPEVEMSGQAADQQNSSPKGEPFDFSTLRFVVKLVTSADGCYRDRKNPGRRDYFGGDYDSEEEDDREEEDDMLDEDDDPWLKVGICAVLG
jgi:hypothetical protein